MDEAGTCCVVVHFCKVGTPPESSHRNRDMSLAGRHESTRSGWRERRRASNVHQAEYRNPAKRAAAFALCNLQLTGSVETTMLAVQNPTPAPAQAPQAAATPPTVSDAPPQILSSFTNPAEVLGRAPTRADARAYEARGESLSSQLTSAQGRRNEIVEELRTTTDPAVRKGLEQRLKVLDDRLANLELEIALNSRMRAAIAGALPSGTTEQARPAMSPINGLSQDGFIAITIVFTLFVLAPLAVAMARRLWRRPVPPMSSPQLEAQNQRLERMEQAIDAVAIEVERISEGQRFVTQLMAKNDTPAIAVARD